MYMGGFAFSIAIDVVNGDGMRSMPSAYTEEMPLGEVALPAAPFPTLVFSAPIEMILEDLGGCEVDSA